MPYSIRPTYWMNACPGMPPLLQGIRFAFSSSRSACPSLHHSFGRNRSRQHLQSGKPFFYRIFLTFLHLFLSISSSILQCSCLDDIVDPSRSTRCNALSYFWPKEYFVRFGTLRLNLVLCHCLLFNAHTGHTYEMGGRMNRTKRFLPNVSYRTKRFLATDENGYPVTTLSHVKRKEIKEL